MKTCKLFYGIQYVFRLVVGTRHFPFAVQLFVIAIENGLVRNSENWLCALLAGVLLAFSLKYKVTSTAVGPRYLHITNGQILQQ